MIFISNFSSYIASLSIKTIGEIVYKKRVIISLILGTFILYLPTMFQVSGMNESYLDNLNKYNLIEYEPEVFESGRFDYPSGSPFGGSDDFIVTAYYLDEAYKVKFGFEHNAIDLIPNQEYYSKSKLFSSSKQVILVATMDGTACSFGNLEDGYTIEIKSYDLKYIVSYHHQKVNFVPLNECLEVKRGMPIGIMGDSGFAFGEHVHYSVFKLNELKIYEHIDPFIYLSG